MTFRDFRPLVDLPEEEPTAFEADGQRIAVVRVGDEVFAVGEQCTHEDWSLCDGYVEGEQLVCPLHGARFSLRTGELQMAPGDGPLPCFRVRIEAGQVFIDTTPIE